MSVLTAYEVHARTDGHWRIEAIFDEKTIAREHALSLIGGPCDAARVVQEVHDTETNLTTTKVVFRDSTAPVRSGPSGSSSASKATSAAARAGDRKNEDAAAPAEKKRGRRLRLDPVTRYGLYVAGVGSGCVALIFGLGFLLDALR